MPALLAMLLTTVSASARVLLTVDEALAQAFPQGQVERQTLFLTETEVAKAAQMSGEPRTSALATRYVATIDGAPAGSAYFDTHRVRTLDETVMVVVRPDGTIARIQVISFKEPTDYLPRAGWYRQFDGRLLDDELQLDRGIHAVTGATLTATAATAAARRILALHEVIEDRGATP